MARKIGGYAKGRQYEYYIRNKYRKKGYFVVRSSKSEGYFDLVAINEKEVVLIQVSSRRKGGEVEMYKKLAKKYKKVARVVMVYKKKGKWIEEVL